MLALLKNQKIRFQCYSVLKAKDTISLLGKNYTCDEMTNLTPSVTEKLSKNLHCIQDHPLNLLKSLIQNHLSTFKHYDNYDPIVTVEQNFDHLLIPKNHPGRSASDTYYVNSNLLLRTHTSAHQSECLERFWKLKDEGMSFSGFTITADVYRRDAIDKTHYPVFHQMEGVKLFKKDSLLEKASLLEKGLEMEAISQNQLLSGQFDIQLEHEKYGKSAVNVVVDDLKHTLESLCRKLFGNVQMRWVEGFFPFTHPSFELEILFNGEWLEILGCGVMKQSIIDATTKEEYLGWACGMGLERLAMILFEIPDIRLFWTCDPRFKRQFEGSKYNTKFKAYSKYPPSWRDVSFYLIPGNSFHENAMMEIVREVAGDLAENVVKVDEFVNPKTLLQSVCYRITYRSMDR